MKIIFSLKLCLLCMFFSGCVMASSRSIAANLRDSKSLVKINSIESEIDGARSKVLEEQTRTIAQGLVSSLSVKTFENVVLDIRMYDRSYFSDMNYVHSIFMVCSILDEANSPIAVVTEYSTGKETFMAPETVERFLCRCISKLNAMEL